MRNQGGLGQVRGELSKILVSSQPLWSNKHKGFLHCAKSSSCKSTSVPSTAKKAMGFSAAHWQEEFPQTLPPRPRGRPLSTLLFHPYLGARRPELYSCLSPQWHCCQTPALCYQCRHANLDKTGSLSVNKSWGLTPECLCGPAACPSTTHLRGKEAACPACSPVRWLSLAMLPVPQYPFPPSTVVLLHHLSLYCTGPIYLTELPLQFSPLLQRDNAKTLKSSSNPCGRGAMQY